MITYENDRDKVRVKIDGKRVGTILPDGKGGYQYSPKGSGAKGESFKSIEEVKRSLESDGNDN